MLIDFGVENFKSFKGNHTLSMVPNGRLKRVSGGRFMPPGHDNFPKGLLTSAIIFGANASGKTNFLSAMAYLRAIVLGSMTSRPDAPLRVPKFKFSSEADREPTRFSIAFLYKSRTYSYSVEIGRFALSYESLKIEESGRQIGAFSRNISNRGKQTWSFRGVLSPHDKSLTSKTRSTALFLSVAAAFNHKYLSEPFEWFATHFHVFVSDFPMAPIIHHNFSARMAKDDADWKQRILKFLRLADLPIEDILIKEYKQSDETLAMPFMHELFDVRFLHKNSISNSPSHALSLSAESTGTQRLFSLAGPLIDVLTDGDTFVIDEIESSLHPTLVRQIVKMFQDPASNRKGAQLICNTHDSLLMDPDWLRRDQLWIVQKGTDEASSLYSIDSFATQKNESLMRGYLANRYGGIPILREASLFDDDVGGAQNPKHEEAT